MTHRCSLYSLSHLLLHVLLCFFFFFYFLFLFFFYFFFFFFQAEDGIRDISVWLEFRRVLFRSYSDLYKTVFKTLPVLLIVLLSIFALNYNIKNAFFSFLGSISYSIYLFHKSFYLLAGNYNVFSINSITDFILVAILFSVFILLCCYIERFGNYLNKKLDRKSTLWTPVTLIYLVCRLLLEKKKQIQ